MIAANPDEAEAGMIAAEELRARGSIGTATYAGLPPPVASQAVAADQTPLTLLQLPADAIVLVLRWLDARSLVCVAATCSKLCRDNTRPMMTPVEEAQRERASARGHVCPDSLPHEFSSWAVRLAWFEC